MYNWNQFRNIPKFKGMSAQEQARQYFLYQSNMMMEQSANAALAPAAAAAAAGAGGGGRLPSQPKGVDYGTPSIIVGVDDGSTAWGIAAYNYDTNKSKVNYLIDDFQEWVPPMNSDIRYIQNGGYALRLTKAPNPNISQRTTRIIFIDVSGNVIDDITLTGYDDSTSDYYLFDYDVNENSELFGSAFVYQRYKNGLYAGQTVVWFNGKDKPVIHDFDNVNYTLNFYNEWQYSDRKGNFTLVVRDESNSNISYTYSLGKELVLITTTEYPPIYVEIYSNNISHETVVKVRNSNRLLKLIFVSSNQKVETLEFDPNFYYSSTYYYFYGTKGRAIIRTQQVDNGALFDYYYYNGVTGTVSKLETNTDNGGLNEYYEEVNPRYSVYKYSPDTFLITQYAGASGNSTGGRNGTQYTNFKLHYINSEDDKWHTFESPSFYMQWDPQNSDKGLYVLTDNNGSPDATLLYLSGGTETYTTLNPFAYQQGNFVYFTPFGVDSCFLYARNSYSNNLQPYVFKRGKLANGGDTPDLLNSYIQKFGMVLLEKPDFNGSSIYWWGEEVGQWTRIDSLNPSSYIDNISVNSVVSPPPNASNTDVNMKYFGCNPSFAILREVDNSVSNARYHLFSSSDHNITGLRNPSVEGYSADYEQMGSESYMFVYNTGGGNRNIKLYTAKDGLAVDYTTTGGNTFYDWPGLYGVRGYFDYFPEINYSAPLNIVFFDGDGVKVEPINSGGNWWNKLNTKY